MSMLFNVAIDIPGLFSMGDELCVTSVNNPTIVVVSAKADPTLTEVSLALERLMMAPDDLILLNESRGLTTLGQLRKRFRDYKRRLGAGFQTYGGHNEVTEERRVIPFTAREIAESVLLWLCNKGEPALKGTHSLYMSETIGRDGRWSDRECEVLFRDDNRKVDVKIRLVRHSLSDGSWQVYNATIYRHGLPPIIWERKDEAQYTDFEAEFCHVK